MDDDHREMDDPGWRGRVGFITPPAGSMDPWEFMQIAPPGLRVIPTMTYVPGFTRGLDPDAIKAAIEQLEHCATALKEARADIVAQSGSPFAFLDGGLAGGMALQERLEEKLEIPVVFMGLAMINAARTLGLGRAAVAATYYTDRLRDGFQRFFEDAGITVTGIENWVQQGIFSSQDEVSRSTFPLRSRFTLGMTYRAAFAVERRCPDSDCVVILGGALPTLPVVQALEEDLGKPVITNAGAQFWEVFQRLGVHPRITGHGRLLESAARRDVDVPGRRR